MLCLSISCSSSDAANHGTIHSTVRGHPEILLLSVASRWTGTQTTVEPSCLPLCTTVLRSFQHLCEFVPLALVEDQAEESSDVTFSIADEPRAVLVSQVSPTKLKNLIDYQTARAFAYRMSGWPHYFSHIARSKSAIQSWYSFPAATHPFTPSNNVTLFRRLLPWSLIRSSNQPAALVPRPRDEPPCGKLVVASSRR